jgi:hypothetical protein
LDAEKKRFEARAREQQGQDQKEVKMDIQIGGSSGSGVTRDLAEEPKQPDGAAQEERKEEMEIDGESAPLDKPETRRKKRGTT